MWALWNDTCRYPREIHSVLSQSQLAVRRDSVSQGEREYLGGLQGEQPIERPTAGFRLSTPLRPRNGKSANWCLEDNTERLKRSYGSIWRSVFASLFLSHTTESLIPFEDKVWELYFHYQGLWFLPSSQLYNTTS